MDTHGILFIIASTAAAWAGIFVSYTVAVIEALKVSAIMAGWLWSLGSILSTVGIFTLVPLADSLLVKRGIMRKNYTGIIFIIAFIGP